jgi:type II secretory ATPase GspE/PulE/Tfp pilus assembly ATPase PilB-like protein
MVENVFPRSKVVYKVTTERDFKAHARPLLRRGLGHGRAADESIGDLLSSLDEDEERRRRVARDEVSAAADNELVKLVNKIIVDAYNQGASDIHVEPTPARARTGSASARTGRCPNYIEVPAAYRSPRSRA